MCSNEKDVRTRVAKAWSALDRLKIIWKSLLSDSLQRNFFRAIVESVLVYGSPSWILTKQLEDKLGGTYCRMLCAILNKSWQQHPTKELYGSIPKLSDIIREQRTRFASHCWQNKTELVNFFGFFFGFENMIIPKLVDHLKLILINLLLTLACKSMI